MTTMNRYWLMKETRQDEEFRAACTEQVQRMSEWHVAFEYREDLYLICRAVDERIKNGELAAVSGEDAKLVGDFMRDYRRSGFNLSTDVRAQVAELKNRLSKLESDFEIGRAHV